MSKRSMVNDLYKTRKRLCTTPSSSTNETPEFNDGLNGTSFIAAEIPSDTKVTLLHLKEVFPLDKFEGRLPVVIVKHQMYSLMTDRTTVDKHLNDLKLANEIKMFKLGAELDDYCIVFTADYRDHVRRVMAELSISKNVCNKFVNTVIRKYTDVCINKDTLMNDFNFTDSEITQLVKASVLTVRGVGNWWIALPNAGIFMKCFLRGRKAMLTMIRKCKYREILQNDLEQRKWPKLCKLGLQYHMHEAIGADLIKCIQTTSGQLLRLKDT
ncbi:serine/threonine-protein kinase 19-like [Ostrea edulis]|uniref:serine/threonine-protein kinase 19-like n=1 Tax=Ostrea edulis TaxID=37623 RepID=UPI002095EE96|nr:serine/threonine-protein kinase 19-like [Ostrea edulis]